METRYKWQIKAEFERTIGLTSPAQRARIEREIGTRMRQQINLEKFIGETELMDLLDGDSSSASANARQM